MDPPPPKKSPPPSTSTTGMIAGFFAGLLTPSHRNTTDATNSSQPTATTAASATSGRRPRHSPSERVELSLPNDSMDVSRENHHHCDGPTMNGDGGNTASSFASAQAASGPTGTNADTPKRSSSELEESEMPPRTRRRLDNDSAGNATAVAVATAASTSNRGSRAVASSFPTSSSLHRFENDRQYRADATRAMDHRNGTSAIRRTGNQERWQRTTTNTRLEGQQFDRTVNTMTLSDRDRTRAMVTRNLAVNSRPPSGHLLSLYSPPSAPPEVTASSGFAELFARVRAVHESCPRRPALESSRPPPLRHVPMLTAQSRLLPVAEARTLQQQQQQQGSAPLPPIARPNDDNRLRALLDVEVDESARVQRMDTPLDTLEEEPVFVIGQSLQPPHSVQRRTQRRTTGRIRFVTNVRNDFFPVIPEQTLRDEEALHQAGLAKSKTKVVFEVDKPEEEDVKDLVAGKKVGAEAWGALFASNHEGKQKCEFCSVWFCLDATVCPVCEQPVVTPSTTTASSLTVPAPAPLFGQFQFGSTPASGGGFQFGIGANATTNATTTFPALTNTNAASNTSTNSAASTQAPSVSGFQFLPRSTTGANGSTATTVLVPPAQVFQFGGAALASTIAASSASLVSSTVSAAPLSGFQFGIPQPTGTNGSSTTGTTPSMLAAATDGVATSGSDALAVRRATTGDIPSGPGALTPYVQSNLQVTSTAAVSMPASSSDDLTGKRRSDDEDGKRYSSRARSETQTTTVGDSTATDTRAPFSAPIQFGTAQERESVAQLPQGPTGGASTATPIAASSFSFGATTASSAPFTAFGSTGAASALSFPILPAPPLHEATVNGNSLSATSMFGGASSASFVLGGAAPAPAPSLFSQPSSSNSILPPAPSAVPVSSIGAFNRTIEQQTTVPPFQFGANSSTALPSNAQQPPTFQFGGPSGATNPSTGNFGSSSNSSNMFSAAAPSSGLFAAATPTPSVSFLSGTTQGGTVPLAPSLGFFGVNGQGSSVPAGQTQDSSSSQFGWSSAPSTGGSFGNPQIQAFGAIDSYSAPPTAPNFVSNMSSSGQPAFGAPAGGTAPHSFGTNAIPSFGGSAPSLPFGGNVSGGGFGEAGDFQIGTSAKSTRRIVKGKRPVGR